MKVSVVIPTCNDEGTIAAAVESALAQEFDGEFEVIVVNDGSTDGTRAELAKFGDRIRVIDQENLGMSPARNAGVRASHGECVAFLDGDDIWIPSKLRKTIAALDNESDVGATMVYSNADKIDMTGRRLGLAYTPQSQKRAPTLADLLSEPWNILPSTMVMTRAAFDRAGGFEDQFGIYPKWQDTWFTLRARELGAFAYLDEALVLYRVPMTVKAGLERRRIRKHGELDARVARIQGFIHSSDLMQRLVRERFGDRAGRLIAAIRHATVDLLVSAGLTAMLEDDRILARRCYRLALHYGPFNAKTYVRIGWTYLPERVARAISVVLPPRIQRGVSGPAQA